MTTIARPASVDRPPAAAAPAARARRDLGRSSMSVADPPRDLFAVGLWAALPAVLGVALDRLLAGQWTGPTLLAAHLAALAAVRPRVFGGSATMLVLATGGAATAVAFGGTAAGWLLLPVAPALLLRAADDAGRPIDALAAGLMRVFSIAVLAAVAVALTAGPSEPGAALAALGGTGLFLFAVERLTIRR